MTNAENKHPDHPHSPYRTDKNDHNREKYYSALEKLKKLGTLSEQEYLTGNSIDNCLEGFPDLALNDIAEQIRNHKISLKTKKGRELCRKVVEHYKNRDNAEMTQVVYKKFAAASRSKFGYVMRRGLVLLEGFAFGVSGFIAIVPKHQRIKTAEIDKKYIESFKNSIGL